MSKSVKPLLTRKLHIPFEGRNIIVRKQEYGAVSPIERVFTILANRWGAKALRYSRVLHGQQT